MMAGACDASPSSSTAMPEPSMQCFDLLSLPYDMLLTIINNSTLGARDICRLEQVSHLVRQMLTDDDCWKRVFLRERRAPALGMPSNWKAELARREEWSRTWRQRGFADVVPMGEDIKESVVARCIAPAVSVCPSRKKLRRLAALVLPGSLATVSESAGLHVVDPSTPGCFASIGAALACAKPHDTIAVAPGTYNERLDIDKPVDIVGAGEIGDVVVAGVDGPVIQVSGGRVACRVARLRITQKSATEGVPMSGAVRVEGGGVLVLEECAVASSSGHCVVIKGADSCGYILHNEVRTQTSQHAFTASCIRPQNPRPIAHQRLARRAAATRECGVWLPAHATAAHGLPARCSLHVCARADAPFDEIPSTLMKRWPGVLPSHASRPLMLAPHPARPLTDSRRQGGGRARVRPRAWPD